MPLGKGGTSIRLLYKAVMKLGHGIHQLSIRLSSRAYSVIRKTDHAVWEFGTSLYNWGHRRLFPDSPYLIKRT